jgi:hypothetical protein
MKLSLLFLVLFTLLLSSCSKSSEKAPDPAPKFELIGRWQIEATTDTDYTSTGGIAREATTQYGPGGIMEITATEFLYLKDGAVAGRDPYTRRDNVLQVGTSTDPTSYSTITTLTATRLVLTNPRFGATGTYPGTTSLTYGRQ